MCLAHTFDILADEHPVDALSAVPLGALEQRGVAVLVGGVEGLPGEILPLEHELEEHTPMTSTVAGGVWGTQKVKNLAKKQTKGEEGCVVLGVTRWEGVQNFDNCADVI